MNREPLTLWHPLLINTLQRFFPKEQKVEGEVPLMQGPLRIDGVLHGPPHGSSAPSEILPSVMENLGPRTLLEFKGPTDSLSGDDFLHQLACGALYEAKEKLPRTDIQLMTIAHCLEAGGTYHHKLVEHGACFETIEPGVHRVSGLTYPLVCIESIHAFARPGNAVLYLFTRDFLTKGNHKLPRGLSELETQVVLWLCQNIQQLRRSNQLMLYKDRELIMKNTDELWQEVLAGLPPEARLAGLPPEARLAGLPHELLLQQLSPEERLAGLPPEVIEAWLAQLKQKS